MRANLRTGRWLAIAFLASLAAGGARAQGTGDVGGDGGASAIVSPTGNALGPIRRSEPRSEVALSLGAAVTDQPGTVVGNVPVPSRYGLQRGALELEGSWSPSRSWEVFGTLNALAFRWLMVGPQGKDLSDVTVGSTTVGATWAPISLPGGRLDGGLFVRLLLPTSQEVNGVHAWGAQQGLTFRGMATRWLAWFGGASFRVSQSWGTVDTPTGPHGANGAWTGGSASAGLVLAPAAWLRVVAQCAGNVPFTRGSGQLTPGIAFRFLQGSFGAEIAGTLPVIGRMRTFGTVARVSWRLGG